MTTENEHTTAPTRARAVLDWIALVEASPTLREFFDDLIVDHRLAPGMMLVVSPAPLLPLDLNVGTMRERDDDPYSVDPATMTLTERMRWISGMPR